MQGEEGEHGPKTPGRTDAQTAWDGKERMRVRTGTMDEGGTERAGREERTPERQCRRGRCGHWQGQGRVGRQKGAAGRKLEEGAERRPRWEQRTLEWRRSSKKTFTPGHQAQRAPGLMVGPGLQRENSLQRADEPLSSARGGGVFYIKAEVKRICKMKPYGEIMILNKSTAKHPS